MFLQEFQQTSQGGKWIGVVASLERLATMQGWFLSNLGSDVQGTDTDMQVGVLLVWQQGNV